LKKTSSKKWPASAKLPFGVKVGNALLVLLAASLVAYVFTQSILFAISTFVLIIAVFLADFSFDRTWKQNALELGYALAFAIAAWFALGFVLQTDSPINVVTSCSMLPNLHRGDLVFIQGGGVNAPSISVSPEDLQTLKVHKTICKTGQWDSACTDEVLVGNATISRSLSNDVIVFEPKPFGPGLIIHRAFAKLETPSGVFFLTKGDNNAVLDQEGGRFSLVSYKDVKGRVLFAVPYVGFLKLFLFMQFENPQGCDSVLQYPKTA
jgi:hypothetical protein